MKQQSGFGETWRELWQGLWESAKVGVSLPLSAPLFFIYSIIALNYEIERGWNGHTSVKNVLTDLSKFVTVAGAFVVTLVVTIDSIRILIRLYKERGERLQKEMEDLINKKVEEKFKEKMVELEGHIQEQFEQAKKQGFDEAHAAGIAERRSADGQTQ